AWAVGAAKTAESKPSVKAEEIVRRMGDTSECFANHSRRAAAGPNHLLRNLYVMVARCRASARLGAKRNRRGIWSILCCSLLPFMRSSGVPQPAQSGFPARLPRSQALRPSAFAFA